MCNCTMQQKVGHKFADLQKLAAVAGAKAAIHSRLVSDKSRSADAKAAGIAAGNVITAHHGTPLEAGAAAAAAVKAARGSSKVEVQAAGLSARTAVMAHQGTFASAGKLAAAAAIAAGAALEQ